MPDLFVSVPAGHIKKERCKAARLKKSRWWQEKLKQGECYYCKNQFNKKELSMDHIIPLARGGYSARNNVVVACLKCNAKKQHGLNFGFG